MNYVKPPIHTLCVGNAWGEAALLLSSGEKVRLAPTGMAFNVLPALINMHINDSGDGAKFTTCGFRASLPSATLMLKQPISQFRGQASDIEIQRKEIRNTKRQTVRTTKETGPSTAVVTKNRPRIVALATN
eukprot:1190575-Prorocentrum_minimum.AAC.7